MPDTIATQVSENQIKIMQIELSHIYTLDLLPHHHRDPFDRIIIAQAMDEKISIASIDKAFDAYSITYGTLRERENLVKLYQLK